MNYYVLICFALMGCVGKPCIPRKDVMVKAVGGCDRHGYCSVLLEDGTQLKDIYQPVVGGTVNHGTCGRL